jgi:hypothetical protein
MSWLSQFSKDPTEWLLDSPQPEIRYLTLRDLLDRPEDDPQLQAARKQAHAAGLIDLILSNMEPDGYWNEPGAGYLPKYTSTVWSIALLAQLGASIEADERVIKACAYMLDNGLTRQGQFSTNGLPSGTADCLHGNMCWALMAMDCRDERLSGAYEWMARSLTGEGIAPMSEKDAQVRYYAGKCGPNFACGANNKQPCAWGAAKVMLAFGVLPLEMRTPLINRAILQGVDFLYSVDPAEATYPSGWNTKPSGNWWKFGFPLFYITDLLQIVEALVALGYAHDPRLQNAVELIRQKQDDQGRWNLEYDYAGKTWGDYGKKGEPNPWVTIRALRVLKAAYS